MNNQNTTAIKKLMQDASGGTAGPGDRGWASEGVERLFFDEFGAEGFRGGLVEVRHGESERNTESVRVELELAPALAARVIALVTNTPLGEMYSELTLNDLERRAIASLAEPPEENVGGDPNAPQIMRDARRDYSAAIKTDEAELADRRNKEIAELILSQRREKEREKELALEEKVKAQGEPEELDFDLPEAPL